MSDEDKKTIAALSDALRDIIVRLNRSRFRTGERGRDVHVDRAIDRARAALALVEPQS